MALPGAQLRYAPPIEAELEGLVAALAAVPALAAAYPPRWLAIQLLEGDEQLLTEAETLGGPAVAQALAASLEQLRPHYGEDLDVALVDQRYKFFGEAEEGAAPDGLTTAIQSGFTASSGGHGALAALAFLAFVLLSAAAACSHGTRR